MSALRQTSIATAWLALLLLASPGAPACNVPVFRYALERWMADAYPAVVFHRGPLTTNQQALIEALEKTAGEGLANLTLEKVNLTGQVSEATQTLWKTQTNATLPWLVLRYPADKEIERPVWAGPLEPEAVRALVDSPARREVVRRLAGGDSAVWLLLESGNRTRDDAAARVLDTESRELEKSLKLPEADPGDPRMRSDLPLKIAFSTVRVARSAPAERMLVNMVLHIDEEVAKATEPMAFAVIGRGRALPPLVGQQIGAKFLGQVAEFVAGACSCEVKSLNPGFDLLMAADWDALIEGRVVKDPELPPLMGLSQFASAVTNPPVVSLAVANVVPVQGGGRGLVRNLLFVLAGGVVVLALATLLLRRKSSGPPK